MLKDKRKEIIAYVKSNAHFIERNAEALDIYEGNLLTYVDKILKSSLSDQYYHAIKDRILPINILQRYIDKVSTTYSNPPRRESMDEKANEFVSFYVKKLDLNTSGQIADSYSHLFKGFAWEPYVNIDGEPSLRELSFDRFLVMSDSEINPEEETIFIKFMGCKSEDADSMLLFVYTNEEFDAFYLNGQTANEYLVDNGGVNPIGVIPFIYGKRQKNKLIPTSDTDILNITKAIPVLLTDTAGAQMFSGFPIIVGVDVNAENLAMSPNSFWSLKSDAEKTPQITTLTPQSDTDKAMAFIMNIFTLWLETKGVRVGSVGSTDGAAFASGISKVIDEMDVWELKKKSQSWFKRDEEELWNIKLPAMHNYWIKTGQINPSEYPPIVNTEMEVEVIFEAPKPNISRTQQISDIKAERELGTMTLEQAIMMLHPEYSQEQVDEVVNGQIRSEPDTSSTDQTEGQEQL